MGRDYVTYAMESALSEYRQYDAIYRRTILNEAVFLSESLKTGSVYYLNSFFAFAFSTRPSLISVIQGLYRSASPIAFLRNVATTHD